MDKTGHLWISTNKRIIEYDPKTGGQINYQAGQDIVVNSFTKHSCFESQAGEMFYGGNRGIAVFMPYKRLADKPEKIRTHIVDVKMGDESLLTGEQDEIEKEVNSKLMSGSFVVSGKATVQLTNVGDESFSAKIMKESKKIKETKI